MGWRFHKSKKIAPGVRLNFNKKSSSVTLGGKGIHHTVSSTGKTTDSIGIPGSGLYYTSSTANKSKNTSIKNDIVGSSNSMPPESPEKKTSCLGYIGYFFALILAMALFRFLWIACIPVIIYLIRHKSRPKRKFHLIISSIIFVLSIGFFITSFIMPINSISIKSKSIKLDINSTKKLTYELDPVGSLNNDLEFISDNTDIVSLSESKNDTEKIVIKSKKNSGSTIIYIRDKKSNVISNKIKVTVENKEAIKKAKEQKIAEQRKKERQKQLAEQKKKEEEKQQQATTEQKEEQVWIPSTGTKYHSNQYCSNMESPSQVSISDAKSRGYTACKKCY